MGLGSLGLDRHVGCWSCRAQLSRLNLVRLRTAALEHEMAERRESETELRDTMQRFGIFEQAPIGIAFATSRSLPGG